MSYISNNTGFDYHFDSLQGEDEDELARTFAKIFEAGQELTPFMFLKDLIPIFRMIVSLLWPGLCSN
jgi:hypothetical protein